MEEIVFRFIGSSDLQKATAFLTHFVGQTDNQYSYQNCWVAVDDENNIVGAACVYNGALLEELRKPVLQFLNEKLNRSIAPENETQTGEFYLDSLGVHLSQQGKGTGSRMLQFLIEEYVTKRQHMLGLLVDEHNTAAKRLYLKLGFQPVGKKQLMEKTLEHLQIAP